MSDCSSKAFKVPENPELLPCPLCGGDARLHDGGLDGWLVICRKCLLMTDGEEFADQAIAAWNTRHQPTFKLETIWDDIGAMSIGEYRCTCCGESYEGYAHRHCPNCGARVEVVD